ncbi:MAG: sulfatase-like hydrolase/transferase [Verrucomicrobia bacterium]|nr:sulfatase-like hydrolase/transferase [Verrucomicrobiota bacterium]
MATKTLFLFGLLLPGILAAGGNSSPAPHPNFVFILADDSGFADFGCQGHPYARTPYVDSLARAGTRCTRFHATGVTCCPARTGLMTSRWPAAMPPAISASDTSVPRKKPESTGSMWSAPWTNRDAR